VRALEDNTVGASNIAVGEQALANNVDDNGNVGVGYQALQNATSSNNTALGTGAGSSVQQAGGNVCIGQGVVGDFFDSNKTRIRNIGTFALGGATNVVIASIGGIGDGELGYNASSRRYYEDIQPVDKASETLFALRPVSFRAKNNVGAANVKLYGLIAEDVAALDPDLVVYNSEGQPETLRLDSINAMLLNEFLKEHRRNEEQGTTIARQQDEINALKAELKAQAAQIQKVSAQIELSRLSARTVLNDR
jgi:Chaperone of endosialidase